MEAEDFSTTNWLSPNYCCFMLAHSSYPHFLRVQFWFLNICCWNLFPVLPVTVQLSSCFSCRTKPTFSPRCEGQRLTSVAVFFRGQAWNSEKHDEKLKLLKWLKDAFKFQSVKCFILWIFMGRFLWCFFKLSTTFEAKKSEKLVPVIRRWLAVHLYVSARRAWSSNSAKVQKAGQSWLESARDGITPFGSIWQRKSLLWKAIIF